METKEVNQVWSARMRTRERLYKLFHEKGALARFIARRLLFDCFERIGFHVTGDHFYELIPNTRAVARNYSDSARRLDGINWRFAESETEALRLLQAYGKEYSATMGRYGFLEGNDYYSGADALILYVVLRDLKPKKMVEVGQGFSTRIALAALDRNAEETGAECEYVSIDPYARFAGQQVPKSVNFRIIRQEFQAIPVEPLLENCDFLFVDSSHVYKFGSDVEFEFTRVYPNVPPGTMLHVHDIYSPYNYPLSWMTREKRFWNEQYFLEVLLMFNDVFEVYLPAHMLIRQSQALGERLRASLPPFGIHSSAFYLLRK